METILSFNYDLLLEKIMRLASLGKVYGWSYRHNPLQFNPEAYIDIDGGDKKLIHIAKPHGSSNFTSWITRNSIVSGKNMPLYPLKGSYVLRGSHLKVLGNHEIHNPVSIADLILPGEWTWWNKNESTKVEWSEQQKNIFVKESKQCQRLLVVGFSYGEPDRPEFDEILSRMPKFQEVHIIHPNSSPPKDLVTALKTVSVNNGVQISPVPPKR